MSETTTSQLLWCRHSGGKFPKKPPSICIIDTNVFLGAIPEQSQLDTKQRQCIEKCIAVVVMISKGHIKKIIADINETTGQSEIMSEYFHNLQQHNVQGFAGKILKLLNDRNIIQYRPIASHPRYEYVEFPQDERLNNFDPSDKKFIAVSLAASPHYPIIQSMDGKWWRWSNALKDYGVEILFTNPDYAKDSCKKKNRCNKTKCSDCNYE